MSEIKACGVTKTFQGQTVLNNLSLEILPKESLVLMGQSGSGKSVFLKCLLGFCEPDRGTLSIGGQEIHQETTKQQEDRFRHSGIVFQSYALFDSLRLWENVVFGLEGNVKTRRDKAISILETVGLGLKSADLYPNELSGGMKRRASIARAIACSPKYLFFDEPTEGLDPVLGRIVINLIRKVISDLKATAITVTHDTMCAQEVGDSIALLRRGSIQWKGAPSDALKPSNKLIYQFMKGDPAYL
jgi:phospholipid/cholesterol/gamma-HCH transport system ATP-binding protein